MNPPEWKLAKWTSVQWHSSFLDGFTLKSTSTYILYILYVNITSAFIWAGNGNDWTCRFGGLTHMGLAPPPVFGSQNSAIPPQICSRGPLASRSQKNCKIITRPSRGFESRRCHENFTKKTFFPISKNVNYRSVACLWPKLWAFWVLLLSYNCTTAWLNPDLLRLYDGTMEVSFGIIGAVHSLMISHHIEAKVGLAKSSGNLRHYEQFGDFWSGYCKGVKISVST